MPRHRAASPAPLPPAALALVAALLAQSIGAPAAWAAEPPTPAPPAARVEPAAPRDAPFEMETFQLVLLIRDPAAPKLPEEEARRLQAAHLAHLTRMGQSGKAVVCGPFAKQLDVTLRGACIYAVRTVEEARDLAGQDPIVKAGQLRIEAVTWWVGKGYMTFPKAPPDPTR